ncbi:hypothetical protein GOODEAATRI_017467, partial [Goodea atripinnis]
EHHLQRAISAQQVYGEKRDNMVIPVPEAESNITYYDSLYPGDYKMPKQLIHIQRKAAGDSDPAQLCEFAFSLDTEQPDYDLDLDDEAFVNKLKKKMDISYLQFEEMIDRLEKGSGQQVSAVISSYLDMPPVFTSQPVSLPEAKLLLKEDDELIKEVFDYWSRKRKNSKANCLIPTVKQEKRDGSSTGDPYVAFRRRTEKMQTRKNRKNDEASYEKMLKLRRDLSRAVTILEMIKRREKSKRELLHLTLEIVEKRNSMSDFGGEIMAEVLAERALVRPQIIPLVPLTNQYRHQDHMDSKDYKSKVKLLLEIRLGLKVFHFSSVGNLSHGGGTSLSPVVFNAKDLNQYDFPSSDDEPFSQECKRVTFGVPCVSRLVRIWVLLDRAYTDNDDMFHELDPETLNLPPPAFPSPPPPSVTSRSLAPDTFASTSEINTSDRSSPSSNNSSVPLNSTPSSTDLSQILSNIKSCRWRHFRPRTLPLHELDNVHPLFRRLSRGVKRPLSASSGGQPFGVKRPARVVPAPTPVPGKWTMARTFWL